MESHLELLKSQLSKLAAVKTTIEKSMRIVILLASLSIFTEVAPVIASGNTPPECLMSCDYVSLLSMKECTQLSGLSTVIHLKIHRVKGTSAMLTKNLGTMTTAEEKSDINQMLQM